MDQSDDRRARERRVAASVVSVLLRVLFVVVTTLGLGLVGALSWAEINPPRDVGPHGYGGLAPMVDGCVGGMGIGLTFSMFIVLVFGSRRRSPPD